MTKRGEEEVALMMDALAILYREGGFQQTSIEALWARIEKAEIQLAKESVEDGR